MTDDTNENEFEVELPEEDVKWLIENGPITTVMAGVPVILEMIEAPGTGQNILSVRLAGDDDDA